MKKWMLVISTIVLSFIISGCSNGSGEAAADEYTYIGVMLSDSGLGDSSFSDSAFNGLERAREELGVIFDYREIADTGTYEQGLQELVEQGNELVIAVGFTMKDAVEKVAAEHPDQEFLLVDEVSEMENITSLTFEEHEGSFLIGALAGMKTRTDKVGFIGGLDTPLINKFRAGYEQGVKETNPDAEILVEYAGDFGNDKLGYTIAKGMIDNDSDYIFPSAGFTGVGAIQAAQEQGTYVFGVDSDQYFLGEKAVVTSMLKKVDVGLFEVAQQLTEQGELTESHIILGIEENGVGLAPVRVISLTEKEEAILNELKAEIAEGSRSINSK
ncbi:basic membrane protein A [Thalassobacillus cyri]|uniref:Basic membrane protein A n=1 Tax=Thalassobacillus cyri TaxID=571932 RepID=A0A1H4AQQ3_9BACI|nr:BMP family ABC transporter substrate-binding protein [Thalassobacillus cyri]SEA38235.1 basic membrane protein A [Thalassobacillus cyri]